MNARDKNLDRRAPLKEKLGAAGFTAVPVFDDIAKDLATASKDSDWFFREVLEVASLHGDKIGKDTDRLARRQGEATQSVAEALGRQKPGDFNDYLVDAAQRWVLFIDILRKRGNNFVRHEQQGCPPVLAYQYDVVVDGATLERPVNYSLVAIHPPEGVKTDPDQRPYIIIDPRAGHGSGIGGFKSESEVGVALRAGHPVYFCIFTTHPTPSQTLADVTRAEAGFVREVQRRHPNSPKPVVIGNCQGGWAAMLLAATNPDLTGPLVINGAPLSYWSGTKGKNPMRYLGGLFGGVFPAMLAADLGNGQFDGANLVSNFEALNPGNAFFKKYYDVFADTEQEGDRYLEFERWWSGFYFMNEKEIRWIVENLFVGNRLARGGAQLDSRMHVDLRNVRAPVIVFASHGDNITPPAQAVNWIADVYSSVQDIRARGQRIVYTVHDTIGHLGIFVSSSVAKKEHKEIVSTLEAIEALAPGLYEMRIVDETGEGDAKRYSVTFEERTIEDIVKLGDDREHERAFAAISRLSYLGAEWYDLAVRPWVRAMTNSNTAKLNVDTQPIRAQRYFLSDQNPMLAQLAPIAQVVKANRRKAAPDNPYVQWERTAAELATEWMDLARDVRDGAVETWFYMMWGTPWMKALGAAEAPRISEVAGSDLRTVPEVRSALAQVSRGNLAVAVMRMLILLAHAGKSMRRERLERANRIYTEMEPFASLGEAARTRILHQQSLIVEFEPEQALRTLPKLVPSPADRKRAVELCEYIAGSAQEMSEEQLELFDRIRAVLGLEPRPVAEPEPPKPKAAPKAKEAA
ncbi:MAG TPA: alpha/beta fold hydrolase [Usitatibacter sp.]|nr:alpha/beta fold hydrolase [Usitatibacter sp.]